MLRLGTTFVPWGKHSVDGSELTGNDGAAGASVPFLQPDVDNRPVCFTLILNVGLHS